MQVHHADHVPPEPRRVALFRGYHFRRFLQLFRSERPKKAQPWEEMLQRDTVRAAVER